MLSEQPPPREVETPSSVSSMVASLHDGTEAQISTEEGAALLGLEAATSSPLRGKTGVSLGIDMPHSPKMGVEHRNMEALRLLFGAGGIYAAFLYYGTLQEDVFRHESSSGDGSKFRQAWFLQAIESLANVLLGHLGRKFIGGTIGIPQKMFGVSGVSQVCAKAFTSLSLANGLSFPVATLAKSGKMAPVMAGSLMLGGANYTLKEYLQVIAIIGGTALVSMDKPKKGSSQSSPIGLLFIVLSLVMDGITGGIQKRLKKEMEQANKLPLPYDFMYFTNLYMLITSTIVAAVLGEFTAGLEYIEVNPDILYLIVKFSICSAVGQSFIFYTISHFDPLVCSTVTTTRKIFSVLLSIFLKGHSLTFQGWSGIALACSGIISEILPKSDFTKKPQKPAHQA